MTQTQGFTKTGSRRKIGNLANIRAKRDASRSWFEAYGYRVHPVYETLVHDIDLVLWICQQRCRSVTSWGGYHLGFDEPDTFVMVMEMEEEPSAPLKQRGLHRVALRRISLAGAKMNKPETGLWMHGLKSLGQKVHHF